MISLLGRSIVLIGLMVAVMGTAVAFVTQGAKTDAE